ncbi:transmembrane protein, putative [Rhizoctonia solani AG-3 Rhs1AP]|uniref:Transmembrane protein, putative n=1 Tax=Rhizoctonia solani AG-3 Rhs1AP TaxID=1086054 RepID=X8JQZ5_9AGAM|nr:transmembrane protein, putative [Rhizoctonia solani AG-3 Rhs1AP]
MLNITHSCSATLNLCHLVLLVLSLGSWGSRISTGFYFLRHHCSLLGASLRV